MQRTLLLAVALLGACSGDDTSDDKWADTDSDTDTDTDTDADADTDSDADADADADTDADTDTGTEPELGAPPSGYTGIVVLYRGSEEVVVNDPGHEVMSLDLSGDGSTLWAVSYDPSQKTLEDAWWVRSIPLAGGAPALSAVAIPTGAAYPDGVEVRTGTDGTATLLAWPYGVGSAFPEREYAFLASAGPGLDFARVADTENPVMSGITSYGSSTPVYPAATADGTGLLFLTRDDVWRIDAVDGWVPVKVGERDDLIWDGNSPAWNDYFGGLDISASGGSWVTTQVLPGAKADVDALVLGATLPTTGIETVVDGALADTVQLDDAGTTVAYTWYAGFESWAYVGEAGGTYRAVEVDVDGVTEVVLSDDGSTVYGVNGVWGMGDAHGGFFETVDGLGRVRAGSGAFVDAMRSPVLSDDGLWYAAAIDVDGGVATHMGALVGARDTFVTYAPYARNVGYAVDGAADELRVFARAEPGAATSAEVKEVYVLPLYDRYVDPSRVLDEADDPTWLWRGGGSLTPVKGDPGAWEGTLSFDGKFASYDDRFSFRLVVTSGLPGESADRAAFYDFSTF